MSLWFIAPSLIQKVLNAIYILPILWIWWQFVTTKTAREVGVFYWHLNANIEAEARHEKMILELVLRKFKICAKERPE